MIKKKDTIKFPEQSLSKRLHDQTRIEKFGKPFTEEWPEEWVKIYYKSYPRLEETILPEPKLSDKSSFKNTLINRRSVRNFSGKALSLYKLSTLLYYSAGIKKYGESIKEERFYPSAGGRYPLEVYLITQNTEIGKGIFHYYLKNHSLEKLLKLEKFSFNSYFNQKWARKASCIILISAVFERSMVKYKSRGYRYALVEAGHLAQNFYLNSEALGIGCCSIGGYLDGALNELLDLDEEEEQVVYAMALGEKT